MRKLSLGGGPAINATVQARLDWTYRAIRTIEQGSQENDVTDLGQNFTFDAAATPTRSWSERRPWPTPTPSSPRSLLICRRAARTGPLDPDHGRQTFVDQSVVPHPSSFVSLVQRTNACRDAIAGRNT
jgi:hypothetical protein